MQKLICLNVTRTLRSSGGSILVGAVAFSVILFIASVGYLQLLASVRNNVLESLLDDRALLAAESGVFMGTRWLSQQDVLPADSQSLYSLSIGEFTVDVSIVPVSVSEVDIRAVAVSDRLRYEKRISWAMKAKPGGWYGAFLGGVLGNGSRAQGGFIYTTFDGPMHANEAIVVSVAGGNVISKFLDPVTVHHTAADHWDYGDGTHHDNNYDWGVEIGEGHAHDGAWLDQNVFLNSYRHHQERLVLPRVTGTDILLPLSDPLPAPNSEDPNNHRAFLRFVDSQATYYYYEGGDAKTLPIRDINNRIIRAPNELSVAGTLSGRTTVVTDPGCNLYPVGDLVYQDFSPDVEANYENFDHANNYGVPMGSSSSLALVSGADIFFPAEWWDPRSGKVEEVSGTGGSPMYVTAALIATEPGATHRLIQDKKGLVKANAYGKKLQKAGIRIIGSRTLDQWFQTTTGAFEFLKVCYDRRLSEGLYAPGITGFKRILASGDSALVLTAGTWREQNIRR